jgi:hypothetical protein
MADSAAKTAPDKRQNPQRGDKERGSFDWVTERSSCSLPRVFHTLLLQAEADVKTRNNLRPPNSPYEFSIEENGSDFKVVLTAGEVRDSVTFALAEHAILVRGGEGNLLFEVGSSLTPEGECHLVVNNQPLDFWQVRRMALEGLFFSGR